eukprot:scaffold317012_cov30-Tisochrysis_lutea.AAC.2
MPRNASVVRFREAGLATTRTRPVSIVADRAYVYPGSARWLGWRADPISKTHDQQLLRIA